MRRSELRASPETGLQVFRDQDTAHLVHANQIRTVHPIVLDGEVWFHSAPKGEKTTWLGEHVTLAAHHRICAVPSSWMDPERACPATTYYRSGQIHGVLTEALDPILKARVLQALMERYQPQGGYRPITADDPLYAKAIRGLCVARVEGTLVAREKRGQNLQGARLEGVLKGLWDRGSLGDDRAIEAILAGRSEDDVPSFLRGPHGTRLLARIPDDRIPEVVELVRDASWNARWSEQTLQDATRDAPILVGVEHAGRLIGTARALSDRAKMTYVMDVVVEPSWRGRGIGRALIEHLLRHPWAQTCWASLHTLPGTAAFYEPLGFERWPVPAIHGERVELRRYRPER